MSDKYELSEGIEKVVLPGSAGASNLTVMGNTGNNTITSGAGDDTVMAGAGDDTIYTGSGDDKVEAGNGNDLIIGGEGAGDDSYDGGSGTDTIKYTSATAGITVDLLKGKATSTAGKDRAKIGNDTITSVENLIAGYHSDRLLGTNGRNSIQGLSGNDKLYGRNGHDKLNGGTGNDKLYGAKGKDVLIGAAGNDYLKGGSGHDKLVGGQGNDQLWGQAGRDTFVLSEGSGYDRIMDFTDGVDRIQVGSGVDNLMIKNRNGHVFIYEAKTSWLSLTALKETYRSNTLFGY